VFTGKSGYATQNILDQVLADFVTAHTPISPAIQARIHCFDPNPGSGAACTTGSP